MYKTLKISIGVLVAAAFTVVALLMLQSYQLSKVSAQEGSQEQSSENKDNNNQDSYTFKAQPGDSYTKIARKAVQTYGIDNNVNLSSAGIVFAETSLTQHANSPELEVGQEVKISKDSVKKAAEEAGKLSDSQQKAWSKFAANVDFNTNSVGQE